MAEEVQISNVGGDGVASEVTLLRLTASIEALAKKAGIDPKAEAAKLQKLHNEATKSGITAVNTGTAATTANAAATNTATKATSKFAQTLGGAAAAGLGSLFGSAKALTEMFFKGGTSISDFATLLPGVGKVLGPFAAYVDESVDAFRSLSASGAAFGNSITNMRNAAAGLEMSLGEMNSLFTQNAERLAMLGGTVTEGADRFAKMNKNIKASGDFSSLKQMGFSVMEINEGMADYIELQASMGTLQGRSTESLAAGSAEYLKQIDLLAKVTGKTRKEAEAAMQKQATDAGIRGLLNALGEGTQGFKNLQMSLALIDEVGGATGAAMKDLLDGMPSGPETAQFMAMLGDGGPAIQDALKKIGDGADPQVLLDAMKRAGGDMEKFANMDKDAKAQYIAVLRQQNPAMAEFLDASTRMTQIGNRNLKKAQEEQAKTDKTTAAMTTFEDSMRKVSAALQKAFIDTGVLDLISMGLTKAAEMLESLIPAITEFAEKIKNGQWISALTGVLIDGIAGLWNNKGVVAALIGGIAVLFAGKAIAGAMAAGIAKKVGSLFVGTPTVPKAPPGASGAAGLAKSKPDVKTPSGKTTPAGKGAGDAIGNIGKGIGSGLGGILKGLAGGISAFANPAVVAGAAALGAAIVLIGGAIAGATWMVGKSLPTMAEGLKSFESLDGAKLIEAGKGMGAIALGMAAFGAGSAIAGLGNLVGSISEGLVSMFGGDDPLTKLQKFQEYDFDAARIESNANALVAYSTAMAALGGAGAAGGIGAAVSAIGNGIAALFGAEDPLTGLTKFQAYKFNTPQIIANAEAVRAYAVAMKDFPSSPAASVFTAAKTGIISLLGGDTNPLTPIKKFGDISLNTSGVIENAGAVRAYAVAMKDFPASPSASVFTAAKNGIISLLGGDIDPFQSMKRFGDISFNTAGIIANAGAVRAYAVAMKDFPTEQPSASIFKAIKDSIITFLGGSTDPFEPMKKFGDLKFNTAGIITNASAVKGFSEAMSSLASAKISELNIPKSLASRLTDLSGVSGAGLIPVAEGMAAIANVQGLQANLDVLNKGLDIAGVRSYTKAMEDLIETLGKLNVELSKDKVAAVGTSEATPKTNPITSGGGSNNQLNTIMNQVLAVLTEMRDLDDKVEKNTRNISGSNIAQGGVSVVGR